MDNVKTHFQNYLAYNLLHDKLKHESKGERKSLNSFKKDYSSQIKDLMKKENVQAIDSKGVFVRFTTSQTQSKIKEQHMNNKEIAKLVEHLLGCNGSERDSVTEKLADTINKNRTSTREAISVNKKKPSNLQEPSDSLANICQKYIKIMDALKENSNKIKQALSKTGIDVKTHESSIMKYLNKTKKTSATLMSSDVKYSVFMKTSKRSEKVTKQKLISKIRSILKRSNMTPVKFLQTLIKDVMRSQTPKNHQRLVYTVE